ncbi:tape measure protein [uncultured Faecalicoccus sp.]|uniref:tape measure protein n=1 Tax=uncultured Faecalicoccus sp. TaxID=1971760 RepID=UPI002584D4BA|nr:tape measure protein [uncultured Faecalicoccus sp.]
MDSYTVKAILSAVDKGFTSTMKQAEQTCQSLSDRVKSGLGFGVLTGIGSQAFSSLTNGFSNLIGEMNASNVSWKVFQGNMEMLGKSSGDIASIQAELQKFAEQSIYSASDMATTYSQLAAVGTKNCTQLVKGFGGLAAAAENPTQAMKTLSQQATQMAAKPYVQWMDFKLMLEQTPAGIAAVAKEMGKTTSQLVADVQEGTVKTEDFFDAISKVGTNDAFTKLATSYKSTEQAMDGLMETMSNKLQPAWKALDQVGIEAVSGLIDLLGQVDVTALSDGIMGVVEDIKGGFNTLKTIVTNAWNAFKETGAIDSAKEALNSCKDAINNVVTAVSNSGIIETFAHAFGEIVDQVSIAVDKIADFIAGLDEGTINTFAGAIAGLFTAYAGYKVVSSATSKIKDFTSNAKSALKTVKDLYKKIKGGGDPKEPSQTPQVDPVETKNLKNISSEIKAKWEGVGSVIESVGTSIKTALEGVGDVFKSVGTAIADAAKGIGEGIKSALEGVGTVIESIGTAIKSVLEGLAPVIESLGTALATLAKGIGEGIAIALRGLGSALAMIPPTTWLAIGAAALMFGAALALVGSQGEGLQMVLNGVANVISSIAPIVQTVVNGIITGLSLLPGIFESVGNAVKTACEGISEVVTSLGTAISDVVTSVTDGMSKIIDSIGNAISGVLDSLANIIDSIGDAALNAGKGFNELSKGVERITKLNLFDMAASVGAVVLALGGVTALSGGLAEAGNGMKQFADGIKQVSKSGTVAATALTTINAAITPLTESIPQLGPQLTTVSEQIQTFADNAMTAFTTLAASTVSAMTFTMSMAMLNASVQQATAVFTGYMLVITGAVAAFAGLASGAQSAQSAISGLTSVASSVSSALSSLGSVGSSAMQSLVSSFREAQSEAESAGKAIGSNFTKSVQSGLKQLPTIAQSAVSSMISVLNSAQSAAYTSGAYIGIGLANGMRSQLGTVRAVAAQLAAAADEAIQAKARIGSPSKVMAKNGMWIGQGLVNGIEGMYSKVHKAAYGLFDIPQLSNPKMAFAGINASLSDDYSYYHDVHYTIEVPLDVNGREFAKATYDDFDKEGSARAKIKDRIKGVR